MIVLFKLLCVIAYVVGLIFILVRSFNGKIIAQFPVSRQDQVIHITQSGFYSIWINSKAYRGIPLDSFKPKIKSEAGRVAPSYTSFLKPTISNKIDNTAMQLQYYYLQAGTYICYLDPNTSIDDALEQVWIKAMQNLKDETVGFQIKKTLPEFLFPLVLLIGIVPVFLLLRSLKP